MNVLRTRTGGSRDVPPGRWSARRGAGVAAAAALVAPLPVTAAQGASSSALLPADTLAVAGLLAAVAVAGFCLYMLRRQNGTAGTADSPPGSGSSPNAPSHPRRPVSERVLLDGVRVSPQPPPGAGHGGGAAADAEDRLPGLSAFENFHRLVDSLDLSRSPQERSYIEVISAMVATAHARDHETIGHSFRVARYAVTLARTMGVEEAALTAIEWGALLHDVGKIGVPESVLRKQGPLDPAEERVMREHPLRGYQMLKSLLFLGTGLDVVLSHHERWDGRGYPNGLRGEEIPLSARIFAVVDTYDAITSDRPYRDARPHSAAVEELRRVSGHQLDPGVVAAFLEIPVERLETLSDLTRPVEDDSDSASFRVVVEEGSPRSAAGGC